MSILTRISNFISYQTNETKQTPYLPKEIFLEEIFSYLKPFDICQLGLSCKDWHKHTRSYTALLKRQVILLCKSCENNCLIPAKFGISGSVDCVFACKLVGEEIVVQKFGSSNAVPDFQINAKFEAHNIPYAVDSTRKKVKTFFSSCLCMDYASVKFKKIESIELKKGINQVQSKRIIKICYAVNIYLKNRKS